MRRKPSKLTKLTRKSKDVTNSIIVGDIYDFSHGKNTVEQIFKYCTTVESGYIYDKKGNRFDVLCTSEQTDCGSIVGGGMNFQTQINYNGTILSVNSYSGIMSKSTGDKIITALREGIYLEDYLKQNLFDVKYEQRDIARQIYESNSIPSTDTFEAVSVEKQSVIAAIHADREINRLSGDKAEKAKNRDNGDR